MKKSRLFFALILPVVALTGCATTYTQEGVFTNGYSDFRSALDIFVVTFRASEHTPADKVLEYALKRSAELTRKHGFRYFSVVEEMGSKGILAPGFSDDASSLGKKGNLHYPSLRLTIQCYHSEPTDREWIDAHSFR